jgi:glycosyltransferase involved in cell wall biosynthesis
MEAQASGLVVVANDIKGIQCLIENGVSGYLVKDNSLQDYAEIIYKIEQDLVSLANMRQCAIVSVAKFSRDLFIPAYISFLNRLLKDKT